MSKQDLRAKRRRMMEEDDAPDPRSLLASSHSKRQTKPRQSSISRSTPPHTSTGLESGTSSPSSRLKLNFNGRVYRAGDDAKQAKLLQGLQPGQLLGQPDELTIDAAYTAADQAAAHKNDLKDISRYDHGLLAPSPAIEPISSSPAGPSLQQQDSDSDLEIGPASTGSPFVSPFSSPSRPRKRKVSQHPLDVDLPQSYQTLLSLHSALERALMLHISTEGKAGLIASAVAHASSQSTNSTSYKVEIPNLAPYTTIRGTVERGCGFQFGHKQLSQLLWVWQAASDVRIRRAAEDKARGLGFIVSKMNAPTKTGGRTATWGLGIELEIKRHVQEPALELGGASASPRKPHPHVSQSGARDGMSVVALWSQGADSRKECLKRHLGQMVLDQLEDVAPTASARSLEVPNFTPTKAAGNTFAGGYLPTPPRSQHKSKKINIHPDVSVVDIGDFADVPLAPLPSLASHHQSGEGSTSQINFGLLQAGFEDLSPKTTSSTNKPSTKDRASSLMERIKSKELSQNTTGAKQPKLGLISPTRKSLKANTPAAERERQRMAALKRKSMLSRLPDVADAVYMLFASRAVPPSPSSGQVRSSRKAIQLDEVCAIVVKSAKIAMSVSEASESVKMLCELCPHFVHCSTLESTGKQLWISAQCANGGHDLREAKATIRRELVAET